MRADRDAASVFISCPVCHALWLTRARFLEDSSLRLMGFRPGNDGHSDGTVLFNHNVCGTTVGVELARFEGLTRHPKLAPSAARLGQEAAFCVAELHNEPCPPNCSCEYVWHLMGIVQDWPKDADGLTPSKWKR